MRRKTNTAEEMINTIIEKHFEFCERTGKLLVQYGVNDILHRMSACESGVYQDLLEEFDAFDDNCKGESMLRFAKGMRKGLANFNGTDKERKEHEKFIKEYERMGNEYKGL